GFSMIELLVVVALIGIIGTITTQVFILALQTQVKSEIIKEVKQNGDYALSVMESMVRNSTDILSISCNETSSQLTIQNPDGFNTVFDCTGSNISSISGSESILPTPTGAPLTNSKVKVSSCTFRVICPTPPINPKYVYIEYTVSQAGAGTGPKDTSSLNYQTTVSLRNYQ
ncbi:type II secretion system protein, partial [Candidatus Gottesmanbacteria bacterium]|nr:type II secretion system protein [Candidatus Gottesmanbacteria bacterium]